VSPDAPSLNPRLDREALSGWLRVLNDSGEVAEDFVPAFNALNIFRVPVEPCVTRVSPHAGHRYSVTGWFHSPL